MLCPGFAESAKATFELRTRPITVAILTSTLRSQFLLISISLVVVSWMLFLYFVQN